MLVTTHDINIFFIILIFYTVIHKSHIIIFCINFHMQIDLNRTP